MTRLSDRIAALLSPGPATALALLLANDLVLKAWLGNGATGKLSDFAGLYLFAVFWATVLPVRRGVAVLGTGLLWVLWKTPAADPLLALWNGLGWITLGRVVDPWDLAALLVLPLALVPPRPRAVRRVAGPVFAAACLLSFAATSAYRVPVELPTTEYRLTLSAEEVLARIYALRLDYSDPAAPAGLAPDGPTRTTLVIPPDEGARAPSRDLYLQLPVEIEVAERTGGTILRLNRAIFFGQRFPRDSVRARFERNVLAHLRENEPSPVARPPAVAGAESLYMPRILAPHSLSEARGRVVVSLARPAYLALIEVGADDAWRVVYPVDADDVGQLPAGESTLTTLCATTKVRGDYRPDEQPPPCGVSLPLTPRTVWPAQERGAARPYVLAGGWTPVPTGRLLLLASDHPVPRDALVRAIEDPAFPREQLEYTRLPDALGRLVRRAGGRRAAATEVVLRR